MLPAKSTQVYINLLTCYRQIVKGKLLVVDPSIGSHSSMPGWAVYEQGELLFSGILTIDPTGDVPTRLKEVYRQLRNLSQHHKPDVCIYEEIPVSAQNGRSQVGHASLLKAVGVTLAAVDARFFLGLLPVVWKNRVRDDYVKSDEGDACEMGYVAVDLARELSEKIDGSKKK